MSIKTAPTKTAPKRDRSKPPSRAPIARAAAALTLVWFVPAALWWIVSYLAVWAGFTLPFPLIPNPPLLAAGCSAAVLVLALAARRVQLAWWRRSRGQRRKSTHGPVLAELEDALRDVNLLPGAPGAEGAARLRAVGKPTRVGRGTLTTVELPSRLGKTWRDVAAKHDPIAAALGLKADRLEVEEGAHPGQVAVWIADKRASGENVPAAIASATSTCWHDSLRIGETRRGEPVLLATYKHNTIVGGIMRFGKTSAARIVAAHAMLDPNAALHIVDGKGSAGDWAAARHAAATMILGSDDTALDDLERLLSEIHAQVDERNRQSESRPANWQPPGVLLLMDELQDILTGASPKQRERIVSLIGRIMRKGAAPGVHVLIATQRPAAEEIPTSLRNIIDQRVSLKARDRSAHNLVLGEGGATGVASLPVVAGEALLTDGGETRFVVLDYMDDAAWKRVCKAAPPAATAEQSLADPVVTADPLVLALREVLAAAPGRMLSAEALNAALPQTHRATSAMTLGKKLAAFGMTKETKTRVDGAYFYTLDQLESAVPTAVPVLSGDQGNAHPSAAPRDGRKAL